MINFQDLVITIEHGNDDVLIVKNIAYKDKTLAEYNEETKHIDLSVLNPFIQKPVTVIRLCKDGTKKEDNMFLNYLGKDKNNNYSIQFLPYEE